MPITSNCRVNLASDREDVCVDEHRKLRSGCKGVREEEYELIPVSGGNDQGLYYVEIAYTCITGLAHPWELNP